MRRLVCVTGLLLLASLVSAESIRGLVVARPGVTPNSEEVAAQLAVDEIVLVTTDGDSRFFDALELEITVPDAAVGLPGALSLLLMTTGTHTEQTGVSEINGTVLLSEPITRPGRRIIQAPLREDAPLSASAATTLLDSVLTHDDLPLVVAIQSHMKGLSPEIANAPFAVTVRPVARNIGALIVAYVHEDGTHFQVESYLAPRFQVYVDGEEVTVEAEYLLEPGIHQVGLISEEYQDQAFTVGIDQAQNTLLELPLIPALATVSYTAPRGARVYVDGRSLDAETGVFTAQPGVHTIVVVVGDYTVTRRFSVEEGLEYDLSVTMDVTIEEAK